MRRLFSSQGVNFLPASRYIPVHLEYILTEILKNSFRATVEHHYKQHGSSTVHPLHPVLITVAPPPRLAGVSAPSVLSLRIRDHGGGVSPSNMSRIFSYAFTTAGRGASHDEGLEGGPYAAQHVGGSAAIWAGSGGAGEVNLFGEMTGKGVQTGMGTIAGLGFGLPMSRLYAKFVIPVIHRAFALLIGCDSFRYFGGSLDLFSLEGWGEQFLKPSSLSRLTYSRCRQ